MPGPCPEAELGAETLRTWVMQAQADSGAVPGATTEQLGEMAKLTCGYAELRETNDIFESSRVLLREGNRPSPPHNNDRLHSFLGDIPAEEFEVNDDSGKNGPPADEAANITTA